MDKSKKVDIYFASNNNPLLLLLTDDETETLIEFMKGLREEFEYIDYKHVRHILNSGFISHIEIY